MARQLHSQKTMRIVILVTGILMCFTPVFWFGIIMIIVSFLPGEV